MMKAKNPISGQLLDTARQILTYGLSAKESNRIRAKAPEGCNIILCETYTDLLAYQGCLSFINTDNLADEELVSLIHFYSEAHKWEG